MVLIGGEIRGHKIVIGLLENFTDIWTGHGQTFRVEAYSPTFIQITSSTDQFELTFQSQTGSIRTGKINKNSKNAWVVSCNNRHTIRPCTIWPKIGEKSADILFHLGDQIYADRVYWRWWRYLSGVPEDKWELYVPDISKDYFREYYETWEPLSNILSSTSNIMIPDDHEIKVLAKTWDYLAGGISSEEVTWRSTTEIPTLVGLFLQDKPTQKEVREKFLLRVALNVCQELYLGLRLTNRREFDYFRVINGVSVILAQRITQPFLGERFMKNFEKFRPQLTSKILWMGGLPPVPVRSNFWELFVYRETPEVDDIYYSKFYDKLFEAVGWLTPRSSRRMRSKHCDQEKDCDQEENRDQEKDCDQEKHCDQEENCDQKDCDQKKNCPKRRKNHSNQEKKHYQIPIDPKIILIGGDLHVGCQGKIYRKGDSNPDHVLTFHISSPSSGFPSAYIPQDSIDGPQKYQVEIDKYRSSDPNAVWVDFENYRSRHYFSPGSYADCWQNAMSTGWVFWT